MAKLSARGRTELARVEKIRPYFGGYISKQKRVYALMSDGAILARITTYYNDGSGANSGNWHVIAQWPKPSDTALAIRLFRDKYGARATIYFDRCKCDPRTPHKFIGLDRDPEQCQFCLRGPYAPAHTNQGDPCQS